MSDTNVQECNCCKEEWDCINGLCEMCSDYNYKLQKQSDLLTYGLLQEKGKVTDLIQRVKSHQKGEGCKYFCQKCRKPIWFVDDERMECPHCGEHGFHVPDIDAEKVGE